MAIKPVLIVPNPALRRKANRVSNLNQSILKLAKDMIDTMQAEGGVGLAAPQIGVPLRVIVLQMPENEPFAIVNPEIVKRQGERTVLEACLSVPGYQGQVRRALSVTVKGLDTLGRALRFKADELLAQAFEHEIDHLNGILYTDIAETLEKVEKLDQPLTCQQLEQPTGTAVNA